MPGHDTANTGDQLFRCGPHHTRRKPAAAKKRRVSKPIRVGSVIIGGGAPISVQSMSKTDTRDARSTINQIRELEDCGCEIIRVAVPDQQAAAAITKIKRGISIPLIADIHFDYRLALAALVSGADGLRINPGNIRDKQQIRKVVAEARTREVPIRIGVNFGSLPPGKKPGRSVAGYMVDTAMEEVELLESLDFDLIKIALKAFDVPTAIEAYRSIARKTVYPLHLGITEAGLPRTGVIRSATGIGILLYEGIGDTIRVSLSSHPHEEVFAAYEILKSLNLRQRGPVLISCPSCGRSEYDIVDLAINVSNYLSGLNKPVKIAVMGCVVNGPGEAKAADLGIACGKGKGAIFKKGRVVRTVSEKDYLRILRDEIDDL
ncbi:MAG: flavodoxin-dependent (E)-4-hydroxy-3-methylbut-2-enyl-diphosphate synthase [Dehalococcoidia bacterium]|nr:flavodoxin-dependent (E)-4-hydroxy-3-methylbut-2-enyl-diphosphate synthase [Dehalococcoidia bacterium]